MAIVDKNNRTAFKIPDWGYKDFFNETELFRKGLTSVSGEPGWFYFKIFFHFNDDKGLLGDVLGNVSEDKSEPTKNHTAFNYLRLRRATYLYEKIAEREVALIKFVKYLSFINCRAPWFFNKIEGLGDTTLDLVELTKEKSIQIGCWEDAIDMRISSLFHLYQFACFDEVAQKEIIPVNLRKFDMTIVLFHMPLKYFDTPIDISSTTFMGLGKVNGTVVGARSLNPVDLSNAITYKMFTFKGCEFDLTSINGMLFGNSMENSAPFNLANNSFKIKYDRVYTHLSNSWGKFSLGPDGFDYDGNEIGAGDSHKARLEAIKNNFNKQVNFNQNNVAGLIDWSEQAIVYRYALAGNNLGKIYYNVDGGRYGDYFGVPTFEHSLGQIVDSYKQLWSDVKDIGKSTFNTLKTTFSKDGLFSKEGLKSAFGFNGRAAWYQANGRRRQVVPYINERLLH